MTTRQLLTGIFCAAALTACSGSGDPTDSGDFSNDGEEGEEYEGFDPNDKQDGFGGPLTPLQFSAACEPGERVVIGAVGDVLLHGSLQKQAYRESDGFISLWRNAVDLLRAADVMYANLEGPTAPGVIASGAEAKDPGKTFDNKVYTSFPQFNYHPSLVDDLVESGVDVVSTANNHSLDRRGLGADRTIDELRRVGLPFTGTRKRQESSPWHTVIEKSGFSLAFLACTYGTNGLPDNDDQVLFCFKNKGQVATLVEQLAADSSIDAVIVTPHWGEEYKATPNKQQVNFAHELLDAGATAVIGGHPHVLEPWERYVTRDGRETFVIYSLGNFVSGQRHLPRRSTLLLYLSLMRGADGKVRVSGARHVPLHMNKPAPGEWDLQVIDRDGSPGDSRALTLSMFGLWNIQWPWQEPVANAECEESWIEPHPHDGWIGGSCEETAACADATCSPGFPGGLCTKSCTGSCPDRHGRATTLCVDLGEGEGSCVNRCETNTDCRVGYNCLETARFNQPGVVIKACMPEVN